MKPWIFQQQAFVASAALSNDGKYVATCSSGKAVLWEVASGKKIKTFGSLGRGLLPPQKGMTIAHGHVVSVSVHTYNMNTGRASLAEGEDVESAREPTARNCRKDEQAVTNGV